MNKIALLPVVLALSVGYNVYQTSQIGSLTVISKASEVRENINDDNFRDAFITLSQKNDIELAKNQGKIEGILLIVSKQKLEESEYAQIWHDGYYRGLEQNKQLENKEYVGKVGSKEKN